MNSLKMRGSQSWICFRNAGHHLEDLLLFRRSCCGHPLSFLLTMNLKFHFMLMNDHFSIQILSELSFNVYYFVGVALKLFKTLSCKKIWNIRKIKEYESLAIYVYVLFDQNTFKLSTQTIGCTEQRFM